MANVLTWFITIEILGLIAFPLAFLLFSRLPDRGYAFAKPLALVLVAYPLWLLGLTQFIPNSRFTILAIVLALTMVSIWLFRRHSREIIAFLRREWKTILVAEALFLGFFILWLGIISDIPAINHTEKPMDFGFMNAIIQSRFFPPEDPWLSGNPISYYYFGHFMMAGLAKLTAIPAAISYNLSVGLIPALLATAAFGLVYNLVRLSGGSRYAGLSFGLIAPALLILIGNLEGVLESIYAQGWGGAGFWQWVGIKDLGVNSAGPTLFPEQPWWWWRATRVIDTLSNGQSLDFTITEFPFFSFILGDLHPHMLSLPFVIMFLGVGLNLFQSRDRLGWNWVVRHPVESAAVALLAGSLAFINAWDFPIFIAILSLIVLTKIHGQSFHGQSFHGQRDFLFGSNPLLGAISMVLPITGLAVLLFLPFYWDLSSQAAGVLPVTGPGTRPFLFLLVMGLLSVLSLTFLVQQLPGVRRPKLGDAHTIILVILVVVAPALVWALTVFSLGLLTGASALSWASISSRSVLVLPGIIVVILAALSAMQRVRYGGIQTASFPLLLMASAFYLMVGAELFFLLDFFGNRMNTVFKVYFQSWVLLSIVGSYGLYYGWSRWQPVSIFRRAIKFLWVGAVVALVIASLYYPVGAIVERTGITTPGYDFFDRTLDGLAFIADSNPDEYAAISWLSNDAAFGKIVEAVGDDYSDYGRISSSTGFPTVLGWAGHELQWRGSRAAFEGRAEDVAIIYTSDDAARVIPLLEMYDVKYVYVGQRERRSYGRPGLTDFSRFMKTAFEADNVVIYELREP